MRKKTEKPKDDAPPKEETKLIAVRVSISEHAEWKAEMERSGFRGEVLAPWVASLARLEIQRRHEDRMRLKSIETTVMNIQQTLKARND